MLFTWEDNAIVRERLREKIRPNSMIFTVPLENGYPAPVRLWLPPGLDINDTNTTYPMIYYVYSGPNTNTVFDTFTVGKYVLKCFFFHICLTIQFFLKLRVLFVRLFLVFDDKPQYNLYVG